MERIKTTFVNALQDLYTLLTSILQESAVISKVINIIVLDSINPT